MGGYNQVSLPLSVMSCFIFLHVCVLPGIATLFLLLDGWRGGVRDDVGLRRSRQERRSLIDHVLPTLNVKSWFCCMSAFLGFRCSCCENGDNTGGVKYHGMKLYG